MGSRGLLIATMLLAQACATGTSAEDSSAAGEGQGHPAPAKADEGQTDLEWANQLFLTQIRDERFNPEGVEVDTESNNCGPASLAMLMRQRGSASLDLGAEVAIDHARAMMYADYPDIDAADLPAGATLHHSKGRVLVDDDAHPVYFDLTEGASIAQGIHTGGGVPAFGYSWAELAQLLESAGGVIAHGHITEAWRRRFSSEYGASNPGAVSHFIAVFPASDGEFIVADPMHRGGAVLMSRSELGAFFQSPVNVYETAIRVVAWDEGP